MSTKKHWSRLRSLLETQPRFIENVLRTSPAPADADRDTRAARAIQGLFVEFPENAQVALDSVPKQGPCFSQLPAPSVCPTSVHGSAATNNANSEQPLEAKYTTPAPVPEPVAVPLHHASCPGQVHVEACAPATNTAADLPVNSQPMSCMTPTSIPAMQAVRSSDELPRSESIPAPSQASNFAHLTAGPARVHAPIPALAAARLLRTPVESQSSTVSSTAAPHEPDEFSRGAVSSSLDVALAGPPDHAWTSCSAALAKSHGPLGAANPSCQQAVVSRPLGAVSRHATMALSSSRVVAVADAAAGPGWSKEKSAVSSSIADTFEVAFYSLKPIGADSMHDWACQMLHKGAGQSMDAPEKHQYAGVLTSDDPAARSTSLCGTPITVSGERTVSENVKPYDSRAMEGCASDVSFDAGLARRGVIEVDLAFLDVDASTRVLAARRALRSWRDAIDACIRLLAALECWIPTSAVEPSVLLGGSQAPDVERVERLTFGLTRAEATLERNRSKAIAVHQKAMEKAARAALKASKAAEKASKAAEKAAKVAEKDQQSKLRDMQARKVQKQVRKQANFMSKFVKRSPAAMPSLSPVRVRAPPISHCEESAAAQSEKVDSRAVRETQSTRNTACDLEDGSEPSGVALVFLGHKLPPNGLPLLPEVSSSSVSRWLRSMTDFFSESYIEEACANADKSPQVAQLQIIKETLSSCRNRRERAQRQLPSLLRAYRANRRDSREDRSPRFSLRRSRLRGQAGPKYGFAPYKLLQFDGDVRPAFVGTMRKKSTVVSARRPFSKDSDLAYGYDSADDWDDEEQGEMLTDDEKDKEMELAELQCMGMCDSDGDSEDDDFLDDSDDEDDGDNACDGCDEPIAVSESKVGSLCPDVEFVTAEPSVQQVTKQDDDGPDCVEVAVSVDTDLLQSSAKRKFSEDCRVVKDDTRKRRRKRRKTRVLRLPRVSLAGPVLDPNTPDVVLDRFPVVRFDKNVSINMFDTSSAEAQRESHGTEKLSARKKRRNEVVLDEGNMADLFLLLQNNLTRGRDVIVELFLSQLRDGGFQLPSKAEVARAIDSIAVRGKHHTQWQFKNPPLSDLPAPARDGVTPPRNVQTSSLFTPLTPNPMSSMRLDVQCEPETVNSL